jgi:hypothetical protein
MSIGLIIFTIFHTLISLVGIIAGLVVLHGLLVNKRYDSWTLWFLVTTVATSVTGFLFPVHRFMPSHALGILSLLILPVAIYARYARRMVGHWRLTYVITAMIALYLNCFVLVVQSFMKIPPLKAVAPTQSEPPFAVAQLILLLAFILSTVLGAIRFHPKPQGAGSALSVV